MFEELKGFIRGWKAQGKFPSVPPIFAKKFSDSLFDYQENISWKNNFLSKFQDSEEERLRCAFTYEALGFSMGLFACFLKTRKISDDYFLRLMGDFDIFANEFYERQGTVIPVLYVPRIEELHYIHDKLTKRGFPLQFDEFKYANLPKNHIFVEAYTYRFRQMCKTMDELRMESTSFEELTKKFCVYVGNAMVDDITETFSLEKGLGCTNLLLQALSHYANIEI